MDTIFILQVLDLLIVAKNYSFIIYFIMINSEEGTSLCDVKYKIVFLGDMSVGKSSIIERFIKGYFDENVQV